MNLASKAALGSVRTEDSHPEEGECSCMQQAPGQAIIYMDSGDSICPQEICLDKATCSDDLEIQRV